MENHKEKRTLENETGINSKEEKKQEKKVLSAEDVFEELGGYLGGWTKWHIFMYNILSIFGVTYIGLHSPAIVFLGK